MLIRYDLYRFNILSTSENGTEYQLLTFRGLSFGQLSLHIKKGEDIFDNVKKFGHESDPPDSFQESRTGCGRLRGPKVRRNLLQVMVCGSTCMETTSPHTYIFARLLLAELSLRD